MIAVAIALLARDSERLYRGDRRLALSRGAVGPTSLIFLVLCQSPRLLRRGPLPHHARRGSRSACAPTAPSGRNTRLRLSLNEALIAFFQGRYASAEKSAATALVGEETKGVAAIIAARSAHELGRFTEREQFLDQARGGAGGARPGPPHDARDLLARLAGPPRRGARGAERPLGARLAQPAAAAVEAPGRAGASSATADALQRPVHDAALRFLRCVSIPAGSSSSWAPA